MKLLNKTTSVLDQGLSINQKVADEINSLSSGTIATIIISGLKKNSDIDTLRKAFVDFTINFDGKFKDWKDAWQVFTNEFDLKTDSKGNTTPKEIKNKVFN